MTLREAIEKNFVLKTEYGAGVKILNGLLKRGAFRRQRYTLDGRRLEDVIYESALTLGPVSVVHRSENSNPFSSDPYELTVTLFNIFAMSNDREMLIKLKAGPGAPILKLLLAATPASLLSAAVDLNLDARAGLRLNVTRLLRDLKQGGAEDAATESTDEEDIDLN